MKTKQLIVYTNGLLLLLLASCGKKEESPTPAPFDQELITRVVLKFTDSSDASKVYLLEYDDPDGAGGNPPTITTDKLPANAVFELTVEYYNQKAPGVYDTVTTEIKETADRHQNFFEIGAGLNLTIEYADKDALGFPVGLRNVARTGAASSGTLKKTLKHSPVKDAQGVAEGDITNAGGSVDAEVIFDVVVE